MFAQRLASVAPSATLKAAAEAERLRRAGHKVVDFTAGEPDFPTPEHAKAAGKAAIDANKPGEFEVVVVNPSLLLGPGDLRESSTGDVRLFLERSIPATPAGGMAFVDARDAAAGLLLAFEKGRAGERYLLNAKNPTAAKQAEHLARIDRHVTLADGVITALSSFAKMPVPDLHPFSVGQCVREALETNPVPENIQVAIDCPPSLPPVLGDINQLRIVFANLMVPGQELATHTTLRF
jgi:hypothetical protein